MKRDSTTRILHRQDDTRRLKRDIAEDIPEHVSPDAHQALLNERAHLLETLRQLSKHVSAPLKALIAHRHPGVF